MAKVVKGYENAVMTAYDASMIPDAGIEAIIAYLKTL